jgi:hypothetical protein
LRHALIVGTLFTLTACGRRHDPAPAAQAFLPSSDPDISLTKLGDRNWTARGILPVVSARSGGLYAGSEGVHIDADGTVWRFTYPKKPRRSGDCRIESLPRGSTEYLRCLYTDSTLLAVLSATARAELTRAAAAIVDGPRAKQGFRMSDSPGEYVLELAGPGTRDGRPLVLGRCIPREQLLSRDADSIIDLFRRIRRAVPGLALSAGVCRSAQYGDEIAPGVRAWFAP